MTYSPSGWYAWRNGRMYEQSHIEKLSDTKIAEHWQLTVERVRKILTNEMKRRPQ